MKKEAKPITKQDDNTQSTTTKIIDSNEEATEQKEMGKSAMQGKINTKTHNKLPNSRRRGKIKRAEINT